MSAIWCEVNKMQTITSFPWSRPSIKDTMSSLKQPCIMHVLTRPKEGEIEKTWSFLAGTYCAFLQPTSWWSAIVMVMMLIKMIEMAAMLVVFWRRWCLAWLAPIALLGKSLVDDPSLSVITNQLVIWGQCNVNIICAKENYHHTFFDVYSIAQVLNISELGLGRSSSHLHENKNTNFL